MHIFGQSETRKRLMKTLKNHKHYIHQKKKNPKKTTQKKKTKQKTKKKKQKKKTKQKQKDKIEKVIMTHLVKLDPPQEKEFERSMSV